MMTNLEQLQQSQDSLRTSQERYRSLSRRLLEQQEQERGALARELHDQLGQSLVAISLNLQAIEGELSPASRARVPESTEIIKKMFRVAADRNQRASHRQLAASAVVARPLKRSVQLA